MTTPQFNMLPKPDLLPAYHAKSVREGGQSYFVDDRARRLPSVTTILNATKPQEDRQALARWRQQVGVAEAGRISSAASRRGTQTHKQIQHYLLGDDRPCPESAQPYWDSLQSILSDIEAVRLVESSVFHYDLGYAGKVDCVASFRGVPCVCDWKTADRPKESIDRLHDAPLQLAAYCGAINHAYADQGIKLNHAAVVVAVPLQTAEVFWIDPDQMLIYWQQWQARVEQFYRQRY